MHQSIYNWEQLSGWSPLTCPYLLPVFCLMTNFEYWFATGALELANNTTTTVTCHGSTIPPFPVWYTNETPVVSNDGPMRYTTEINHSTGDLIGILVIDADETYSKLDLRCTVGGNTTFTTSLTIEGMCLLYMTTDLEFLHCWVYIPCIVHTSQVPSQVLKVLWYSALKTPPPNYIGNLLTTHWTRSQISYMWIPT